MTAVADLELQLKGLVMVRALLQMRGATDGEIETHTREIARVRSRLVDAKGGGAYSAVA